MSFHGDTHLMITKGALANVLAVCSTAETDGQIIVDIAVMRDRIQQHFEELSSKGLRTLGVAYKNMLPLEKIKRISPDKELWTALEQMDRDGVNQLPVMTDGRMVGMHCR